MGKLDGRTARVTGGTRGIGRAVAERALVAFTVDRFGSLEPLVNNAGGEFEETIAETTEEARDLLRTERHGQLAGLANEGHARRGFAPPERYREIEAPRRHRGVLARSRDAAGGQIQPIAPQLLRARLIRGTSVEEAEVLNSKDPSRTPGSRRQFPLPLVPHRSGLNTMR